MGWPIHVDYVCGSFLKNYIWCWACPWLTFELTIHPPKYRNFSESAENFAERVGRFMASQMRNKYYVDFDVEDKREMYRLRRKEGYTREELSYFRGRQNVDF